MRADKAKGVGICQMEWHLVRYGIVTESGFIVAGTMLKKAAF